ncbi:gamma carbonic anhydrase family protein [Saccharopolyspora sp. MS10]|uniref:gamma carbonic anhydrase family protein n=1 Tax=Saccharopolyspora sp. MS10 TaxID=3385973 RepID=UPI0039A3C4A4
MIVEFEGHRPTIDPSAFVADGAVLVGRVTLGAQSSVWFHAVLRADQNDIAVGARSNLQDGVVVHADPPDYPGTPVLIGDGVTVGHGAVLHGCTIEDGAIVGSGSVVLDGARIGAGSLVAAGSVVLPGSDIAPGTLAAGSPARVRRELTDDERDGFARPHVVYTTLAANYRKAVAR